jgi:hypothetical protein
LFNPLTIAGEIIKHPPPQGRLLNAAFLGRNILFCLLQRRRLCKLQDYVSMNITTPYKNNTVNSLKTAIITRFRTALPVLWHCFFWALYILYAYSLNKFLVDRNTLFLDILCANLLGIWVFYMTYFFCKTIETEKNAH